ncbi:MAG: bifunctional ornithine acetyltransferase/N-acetylglutamate synthase, partial [Pseudomonadota bacterium]|nr:bifunctional ornithine acetyltransferase/N-acetylglutamate synthase [Pseudomonadota bacterium]
MTVSPLAPDSFPPVPRIAGVTLATAASEMKYRGRDDMLLMRLADGATTAGVFTRSDTAAAPVTWCSERLRSAGAARAILVNAGNANAFTGAAGMAAVRACCEGIANRLGYQADDILMASTGVIGEPLDTGVLEARFDDLATGEADWRDAAHAIMTTDTFAKGASETTEIGGIPVTISGIAKGSGMIAPDMATMLGFIATDAAIPADTLAILLRRATATSFNAITVDSDSSTNDSVLLIASGAASHSPVDGADDPALDGFRTALDTVMQDL